MGILTKIMRKFRELDCEGCGKPLLPGQEYACSDECHEHAYTMDSMR